jgi:pilus assembly protein CpaD
MRHSIHRVPALALASALALTLGGCGGIPTNRGLESTHQPVVERNSFVLDVSTEPGGGLSPTEAHRLAGWFGALALHYGDKLAVDDPTGSGLTRASVEGVAARYGLLLGETAPVTPGYVSAGTARVVVSRVSASVPHCPDWGGQSDFNPLNATSTGYGCAVNGNLAAMVADKEHLIHGANGTGGTVVMSSTKAIDTYRTAAPSGAGGTAIKKESAGGN